MKKFTSLCCVLAVLALSLPGCAYMSKEGRSQKAYERYVKKQSKFRNKQQAKLFRARPWVPQTSPPSESVVSTSVGDGPMAMPSSE